MPTRAELLAEAKKRGHKGFSTKKKSELEEMLKKPPPKPPRGVPRGIEKSKKAGFVRMEIAKGKLKKEGGRVVKAGGGTKPAPKTKKLGINELAELVESDKKSPVGEHLNDNFPDYIERFLDGRGSEEKQLERASARASKYLNRQIKNAIKLGKITSLEEFNKKYDTKQKIRDLFD